jgi:diguanylate cyclase (GGDEF)-like protein/PAS domain S-box-containing protein
MDSLRAAPRQNPGHDDVATGPSAKALVVALVLLVGLVAVHSVTMDDFTYVTVTVGAAILAWAGLGRQGRDVRAAWLWIVLGVTSSAIADVIYAYLHWSRGAIPDVSIADIFWMASYVAMSIGVFRVLSGRGRKWIDLDGLFDMGAVAVVATVVVGSAVISLVNDQETEPFVRAVWASYPVLDVVLVALVLPSILSRRLRTRAGLLLGGGLLLWLLSDFTSTISSREGLLPWLDGGWMVGAVLLAVAVWYRGHGVTGEEDRAFEDVGPVRLLVGLAPLLIPGAIELVAYADGADLNPVPLFAATALLTVLAFGRAVHLSKISVRNKERLRSRERYFAKLATNASDAVVVLDANRCILRDHHLATLLGRPGVTIEGLGSMDFVDPVDLEVANAAFDQTMSEVGVVHEVELRLLHADGSSRWFSVRSINLIDDADIGGMVVNLRDITDRKRIEDELDRQSFHDTLTGLANRALFHDRVDHALQRASRSGFEVAAIVVDLDGFKLVNEMLGHDAGDTLLRELATRLELAVRSADTVARLSGDQFGVLVEYPKESGDGAHGAAEGLLYALSHSVSVAGQDIVLTASVGIAIATARSTTSSLLRDADIAMYRAKATGKGKAVTYQPEMRTASAERQRLESDLVHALANEEFKLVYQPVLDLMTERVVGFEALLRWHHPTVGLVMPDKFIPIIEDNGSIVPIGRWVLRQACLTAARWQSLYGFAPPLTMAVNVSTRQIEERGLVTDVADALQQTGFDPACLILEITETALVKDAASAADRLEALRRLGPRIAVDDFGAGYASLAYLHQFPIDILKIDRSFIDTINERDGLPPIVRGVLELGKTLGLEVVAEGIEEEAQRDLLREGNCPLGQGYLFARPLSESDAEGLLIGLATARASDSVRAPAPGARSTEPVR